MSPDWLAQCYERPDELQPNSDIGGIGVLIGFMGTSGLVILFVIVHYIFAFNPSKDPFTGEETTSAFENHERKWTPNSIDETITMTLLSRLRDWLESRTKQRLRDVLTKAILTLCDVQLSTGLGILLSGYINLFHNAILAYHWKLLVYLVWISNLTHVCCLTILRGYLSQHRWERIWRVVLMFVLWGGLLSAFVPTLFLDWKKNDPLRLGATNTRCFFNPNVAEEIIRWRICKLHENGPESNMTAKQCVKYKSAYGESPAHEMEMSVSVSSSMILVFFTFHTRLVKIVLPCSVRVKTTLRIKPSKWLMRRISKNLNQNYRTHRTIPRGNLILLFQMTLYFALKIHLDSLLSDFVDILFLIVSATWGTVRLLNHRSSIKVDEDGWGFGQILAVFLLIGPVIAMITPLLEIVRPNKVERMADNQPWMPLNTWETQATKHVPALSIGRINESVTEPSASVARPETSTGIGMTEIGVDIESIPREESSSDGLEVELSHWSTAATSVQYEASVSQINLILPQVEITKDDATYPLQHFILSHLADQGYIGPRQLKHQLNIDFANSRWIRQVILLTCFQFLLFTADWIYFIVRTDTIFGLTVLGLPLMGIGPSLTCFYFVALGLRLREDHIIRREILSFPAIFWIIPVLQAFRIAFFAPAYASVPQAGVICLSLFYLFTCFLYRKIRGRA